MRWAIAFHPDQVARAGDGRWRLMVPPIPIAEDCLPAARGQGWIVLGTDSQVYHIERHDEQEEIDGA